VTYFSLSIVTMDAPSMWKTSSIGGGTVKEYEDQWTHLRKENFNLKLRIYFLEERLGYTNATHVKEDHMKKNIELKVECSFPLKVCVLLVYAVSLSAKVITSKKQT
jgi:hypothetical protein